MHKLTFIGLLTLFLIACKSDEQSFNGYIDAQLVYLSSDFAGRLVSLPVHKGQLIKENQFLFELEQTSEHYHVQMSQLDTDDLLARREQALAQLRYNELNYERIVSMRKDNAASQNDLEAALRDYTVSKQQIKQIDAQIKSSQINTLDKQWQIARKQNSAPETGIVFDTYYLNGEFVPAGTPVLSLITKNNIKVIFFVPEKQLDAIRLNREINIMTDENAHFAKGHIFYISNIAEYTPPIIYSREQRQRLVFRVEALIDSPNLEKLHLGQPVTLELAG